MFCDWTKLLRSISSIELVGTVMSGIHEQLVLNPWKERYGQNVLLSTEICIFICNCSPLFISTIIVSSIKGTEKNADFLLSVWTLGAIVSLHTCRYAHRKNHVMFMGLPWRTRQKVVVQLVGHANDRTFINKYYLFWMQFYSTRDLCSSQMLPLWFLHALFLENRKFAGGTVACCVRLAA